MSGASQMGLWGCGLRGNAMGEMAGEPGDPRAFYFRRATILMQRRCRDTQETEAMRDDERVQ